MSKSTRNSNKHWSSQDVHQLKQLASQNTRRGLSVSTADRRPLFTPGPPRKTLLGP